jgi:hypothetical protein
MRGRRAWRWLGIGVALAGALATAAARADLLRCTGPDGRTIFTDDKSACPEASPYQPQGQVQSVEPGHAPETRASREALSERAEDAQAGEAERWRQRKATKEQELRQVVAQREQLAGYVAFCNRGNNVFTRDQAGIRSRVPCSELSKDLAALDAREAGIREYLAHGLADECRRAGCLPGWIR